MAFRTGGNVSATISTPLQCLDCAQLMSSGTYGVGRCRNHPEGIPQDKRSCLCLQHEYRLRLR